MFTRAALCTLGAHPFQRPRTPCLLMMFKKACLVLWTLGRYWINITLVCRNVKNKSGLHGINIYGIKICTSWHHELQSKNKRTIIHNYKVSLTFLVSPPDVTIVQHISDYQILLNSFNLGYISGEVPSYLCTLPTSDTDLFPQNLSDLPQSQHP